MAALSEGNDSNRLLMIMVLPTPTAPTTRVCWNTRTREVATNLLRTVSTVGTYKMTRTRIHAHTHTHTHRQLITWCLIVAWLNLHGCGRMVVEASDCEWAGLMSVYVPRS